MKLILNKIVFASLPLIILTFYIDNSKSNIKSTNIFDKVTHHYANNDGVKIHYVEMGKGPAILFIHGFPDFWYTWRHQMEALSKTHRVIAMDLRGYNLSDKPEGKDNYTYDFLMKDVASVIEDAGIEKANIVAHDWGAAIAWNFAAYYPKMTNKLTILSIAHLKAGNRQKTSNIKERKSSYADTFVTEQFKNQLTENWFSGWIINKEVKEIYKSAFRKSDKDAMINYYKANFPTLDNLNDIDYLERSNRPIPNIKVPVLVIHGKKDKYSPTRNHNNTWDFVDNELTISILPDAGHFIQQDESEKVTKLIKEFLFN